MNGQIGKRTATAAAWLVAVRLLTKSIDFIALLVLARLLTPADFGLVAIAMTLIFVVEAVLELPINQVLVLQPVITRTQLDTAFTLAVLRGLILAALLAAVAWPFALIYGDMRLAGLVLALGCAPIFRGLLSPRLAEYARVIDYRRDFVIDIASKIVSFAFSITLAWQTHSYWALVLGTVFTPLAMAITSYVVAPYRPRLSLREWPLFSAFAGWSTVTQLLSALSWQCDRLVLGHFASRRALGTFSLANDLSSLPELALIKPIMRPLMAAMSHVNDSPERLRSAYQRASVTLLAVGSPVMLGLCLLADPIVRLMLGGKWLAAIPVLQLLPLSLIPPLLAAPFWSLAMAVGRPRLFAWQALVDLILRSGLIVLGAMADGVAGVVVARIAASLLSAVSAAWCVRMITGASIVRQFAATWRVVLAGAMMSAAVLPLRELADGRSGIALALALAAIVACGAIVYLVTLFGSWHLAGQPSGIESWCIGRLREVTGWGERRSGQVYALLPAERWREWHQNGELVVPAHERAGLAMLMQPGEVMAATANMARMLDMMVLVQIDNTMLRKRGKASTDTLPLSAVRRAYHLRDLLDTGYGAHFGETVLPFRVRGDTAALDEHPDDRPRFNGRLSKVGG